jgi:hypothetical protein
LVAEDVGVVQGAFVEELHELGDKEDREDDELLKGESAQAYICEERVAYVELPSNLALFFGGEFDIQTGEVLLVSHVVVVPLRGMSFFEAFGGALGILHRSHFSLSRGVHGRMSSHDGFVRARILVFQTASSGRGSQRTVNEDDFERNQTGSQKINAVLRCHISAFRDFGTFEVSGLDTAYHHHSVRKSESSLLSMLVYDARKFPAHAALRPRQDRDGYWLERALHNEVRRTNFPPFFNPSNHQSGR